MCLVCNVQLTEVILVYFSNKWVSRQAPVDVLCVCCVCVCVCVCVWSTIRQLAVSEELFKVTTLCLNTWFPSSTPLVNCIIHHTLILAQIRLSSTVLVSASCTYQLFLFFFGFRVTILLCTLSFLMPQFHTQYSVIDDVIKLVMYRTFNTNL